jgi:hypothetical protein
LVLGREDIPYVDRIVDAPVELLKLFFLNNTASLTTSKPDVGNLSWGHGCLRKSDFASVNIDKPAKSVS